MGDGGIEAGGRISRSTVQAEVASTAQSVGGGMGFNGMSSRRRRMPRCGFSSTPVVSLLQTRALPKRIALTLIR